MLPKLDGRLAFVALAVILACAPQRTADRGFALAASGPATVTTEASGGCQGPVPATPTSLASAGAQRDLLVRVPPDYRGRTPRDLVVAFHGRTNDSRQVRRYFDLDDALPQAIIVYPSALPAAGGFRWSDPGDAPSELRDYLLFDDIVARIAGSYCIDLGRVFVVGHSLGASFASSVACHRGAAVRAVAAVAGGIEGAACTGGAAALLAHHPDDQLVPLSEGRRARDAFLAANGVAPVPVPASEPELQALGCVRYGSDHPDPVIWCTHDDASGPGGRYYPHTWPDAAAAAIARFFTDLE